MYRDLREARRALREFRESGAASPPEVDEVELRLAGLEARMAEYREQRFGGGRPSRGSVNYPSNGTRPGNTSTVCSDLGGTMEVSTLE